MGIDGFQMMLAHVFKIQFNLINFKIHVLVINTKECRVTNLLNKSLQMARLVTLLIDN